MPSLFIFPIFSLGNYLIAGFAKHIPGKFKSFRAALCLTALELVYLPSMAHQDGSNFPFTSSSLSPPSP
jgi:hypothetical protein